MKTASAPGRKWAYFGLILGLAASVAGNVANTILANSPIHLGLRIPFAVLWPVLTWVAIEVLTRTIWSRTFSHIATRVFLAGPVGLVAAFVSYLHLHHLMMMAGEPGLGQAVGPLAIDGTLFGCTVALLVTRAQERASGQGERRTLAERVAAARNAVTETLEAVTAPAAPRGTDIGQTPAPCLSLEELGPEVPAQEVQPEPEAPKVPVQRKPRTSDWSVEKAVQMILEGQDNGQVGQAVGISPSVVKRVRRAVAAFRTQGPSAEIPSDWKVPAPVVSHLREESRRWS